jgi:hypothetical protein
MTPKLGVALAIFGALALAAWFTLDGKILIATLIFLGGFAIKMCLVVLKNRMD